MPRGVLAAALLFSGAAASTLRGPSAFEPHRRLDDAADHVGRHLGAVFVELVADKIPISSNVSLEFTPIFPVGGAIPGEDDGHYLSVLGMSKDNATALHAACPVTKGIISASCLNAKEDLFYWEAEVKPAGTAVPPDPKDVDPDDVLLVPAVANGSVNATIAFTEEAKGLTLLFLNVGIKEVAVKKLERVTAGKAATPVPDFTLPAAVVEPKPKRA